MIKRQFTLTCRGQQYNFAVQLTFELHRFEMHGSTYMWIKKVNTQYTICIPGVHIHGFIQVQIENNIVDSQLEIHDAEIQLCALFHMIL